MQWWIVSPVDRDLVRRETISKCNAIDLNGRNCDVAPVTRHAAVFRKQRHKQLTAEQYLIVYGCDAPSTREKLRQRTQLAQTHRRGDFSEAVVSTRARVELAGCVEIATA